MVNQSTIAVAACLAGILLFPSGVIAHPHVWVAVRSEVQFDAGRLTGVTHRWTFDELYSTFAVEGLDTNDDGIYDGAELAELARTNVEGLKEFMYFTRFQIEGTDQPLAEPVDYHLERAENGILTLVFTVPLQAPLAIGTLATTLSVYDESYYIAFGFNDAKAVTLSAGAPAGCTAEIPPPSAEETGLGEAFGSVGFSGSAGTDDIPSQTARITCAAS